MRKHGTRMTAAELKSLYPDIKLMEGYDEAFVGVVPAPQSGCIAVYDSTKIIDILSRAGFTDQKDLIAHFEKVVSSAQVKDGAGKIGPLFMQSVVIRDEESPSVLTEADLEEHRARIERHRRDEEGDWHVDYDLEGERGEEGEPGEDDSGSDSEHYDIGDITFKGSDDDDDDDYEDDDDDDDDDDDLADSGYDSEPEAPYMEIIVEIGLNSPEDCMITRNVSKIKEAMRLIFPKMPRLDMISKANFILRDLGDLEDADTEGGDDEFPYMPPGSL